VEELLSGAHKAATKLLGEHKTFLGAVAAELLAEETLTLADVHEIAARFGVVRHAHVPAPLLPIQISVAKPVAAVEVASVVAAAGPKPVVAGRQSRTGATQRRPLALARALVPWPAGTTGASSPEADA
jgi:hypothetical protein